jgi:hypothetical protein
MRTTYWLGQTTDLAYSIGLFVTIHTCHLSLMKGEETHMWANFAHFYGVNDACLDSRFTSPIMK